jgi:hypothetical protein
MLAGMGRRAVAVAAAMLAAACGGCEVVFPLPGGGAGGDGPRPESDGPAADGAGPTDATRPDALPDGPSNDVDGDGVLNDADNCRDLFNPLQRDEDGDAFGDVCDRCVGIPDPLQSDSDLDDVGDACDLRSSPTPTVVLARYFVEGGGSPADWAMVNGVWTVDTGRARSTDQTDFEANLMYQAALPDDGTIWVEVGLSGVSPNPGAQVEPQISVWVDADTATLMPSDGHRCALRRTPTVLLLALMFRSGLSNGSSATAPATQILAGPRVNLSALRSAAGFTCAEFIGGSEVTAPAAPFSTQPRIGLHTSFAAANFDYVVIYLQP